eukprot:6208973-Amphidinium_carterae.1
MHERFSHMLAQLDSLSATVASLSVRSSSAASDGPGLVYRFVVNESSVVVHRIRVCDLSQSVSCWSSWCGWRFGHTHHRITDTVDDDMRFCARCWPDGSSSSSSSTS